MLNTYDEEIPNCQNTLITTQPYERHCAKNRAETHVQPICESLPVVSLREGRVVRGTGAICLQEAIVSVDWVTEVTAVVIRI